MRVAVVEPVGAGGMIHFAFQMSAALSAEDADVTLITATDYELESLPHSFAVEPIMRLWPRFDDALTRSAPESVIGRAWRNAWWTGRRGMRAARLLREWARVVSYLRRERPDIVQFGELQFPGARFFLTRLNGMTLAQVCHEFEFRESRYHWSNRIRTRLMRRTYEPFDAVFVLGEEVRTQFARAVPFPVERIHVIPHGNEEILMGTTGDLASLRQRYGIGADDRVVLFFGNIRPSKGVPDLIDAFAGLHDIENAKLVIAGFPSREVDVGDLKRRTDDLGISDRVVFDTRYVPIEEVASLMALSTVVAFPYVSATQSGAIQVAFAAGRPVVATAVGSIPEAVQHGTTGLLVPQGSIEEMSAALRRLVADPGLARAMGEEARRQAGERFSWNAIAREVLSIYRSLLAGTQRAEADAGAAPSQDPVDATLR